MQSVTDLRLVVYVKSGGEYVIHDASSVRGQVDRRAVLFAMSDDFRGIVEVSHPAEYGRKDEVQGRCKGQIGGRIHGRYDRLPQIKRSAHDPDGAIVGTNCK